METAVIGYPRIGTLRELKFASEKYFRNEITEEELKETAAQLKKSRWERQKRSKIDHISSNDFSYYDMTLDAAVMFGIIPERYKELKLSELDTYFAMARGYQGQAGDVKALAMKKWFNTNYHYIVPEIEDDTVITLCPEKLLEEYEEAKDTLWQVLQLRAESVLGQLDGTIPSTDDGQQNAQDTLIDGSAIDLSVMGEFNH